MAEDQRKDEYRFEVTPHSFGFRAELDLDKLDRVAQELEDEERIAKMFAGQRVTPHGSAKGWQPLK